MKLNDKILYLRKKRGMTQEDLADALNVSRQAVSRWEVGSALPDAVNILQLSKLFEVSADYLLNDEYDSEFDVPTVKNTNTAYAKNLNAHGVKWLKTIVSSYIAAFGLLGNFIIYLISRFIKVRIPVIVYENGRKMYRWSSDLVDYSYKYFISEHNLELVAVISWLLCIGGLVSLAILYREKIKKTFTKLKFNK